MLQTGHADRLTWIKSTKMIPPIFRETRASPLHRSKDAVRRFKESQSINVEAKVVREVVAPGIRRAQGGMVPDTIHRIRDARKQVLLNGEKP